MPPARIDIVVHRESVVHSLIEFEDNSVLAQLGVPDMRVPIQYALTYPERAPSPAQRLDLTAFGSLTFQPADDEVFPGMQICRRAAERGGLYPAAVNAANEEANALFRRGEAGFTDIFRAAEAALNWELPSSESLPDVLEADRESRRRTAALLTGR